MSVFRPRWVSELLHLCYFSYYPIVFGLVGVLYYQGRHEAFHEVVFGEVLTFNLCLIWYIFMPVMGPRYTFEKIRGPLAEGHVFKLVHMILSSASSKGTAFPSSHCAIGVIVVLYAARYDPVAFAIMCPLGVGLVVRNSLWTICITHLTPSSERSWQQLYLGLHRTFIVGCCNIQP